MASTYIQALIIKHRNDVFFTPDGVVGELGSIPTPGSGGRLNGDYWANPITDFNIVSGFDYIPRNPGDALPADMPQAFPVFRLIDEHGNDYWVVYGESTNTGSGSPAVYGYVQAAADAECCDTTPRSLPLEFDSIISPCQNMCLWDANNKYFAQLALPTLGSGQRFYPSGYFNGVALTAASASGYTTASTLLTFLNASWSSVGTWTILHDGQSPANSIAVKVTQTAGSGDDVLCAQVIAITP